MKKHKLWWKITIGAAVIVCIIAVIGLLPVEQPYSMNVAVLYSGDSETYLDTYQHFSQPILMNLKVTAINADKLGSDGLKSYDMVYPDISIRNASNSEVVKKQIVDYAASGGAVFLENSFYDWFSKDFLGAASFKQVGDLQDNLELPEVRYDLQPIQRLVNDYYSNFKRFRKLDELKGKNFGYGMLEGTAVPIVKSGDTALYTLNYYKKGYVFFTNPLLPNAMYINGFDMLAKTDDQAYFNNMVCAANQMLDSEYAAFLSKQKYGYALKRVFGTYGRPAMAWQNHFEVLSAIRDKSMQNWIDITREYDEIPSFSLARGAYEWGTRYESIGYHINRDTGDGLCYRTEEEEAFYEASRHAVVDKSWLTLQRSEEDYGFFVDIGDLPDRAYPFVQDIDADGIADIVSGSSDGYFYYYKGLEENNDWILQKAEKLKQTDGKEIKVSGFSAPVLYDIDGDGHSDLVTGCENGKIYWYANDGNFRFNPEGELVSVIASAKLSAPDIGNVDSDNIPDLVAGVKDGTIYFFKGGMTGEKLSFGSGIPLKNNDGSILNGGNNAAPRLIDLDGDRVDDLAVGIYDGYIKKYKNNGLTFSDLGYFDDDVPNYLGNNHLKNGNNAVPAFADVNGDEKLDLIVGRLEFGMAVPIDSKWFPYKEELKDALKYVEENYVGLEPHSFSNHFKDSQVEQRELAMHKKAFEKLGIKWGNNGTNQHTWRINNIDHLQTLMNQYESGIYWNSGFENVNSFMDPAYGTESTWNIPFYLYKDGKSTGMMLFSPSPSLNGLQVMYTYTSAWDTPVSYYMHTEYDAVSNQDNLRKTANFMDQFRDTNDYNFMTEQQMAKSFANVLNTSVEVEIKPFAWLFNTIQNNLRTLKQFEITIRPIVAMDESKLLDSSYKNVAGVKVERGEKYLSAPLDTDADIFMRKGNDLYIGLNKPVSVFVAKKPEERTYIVRANLPIEITKNSGGMSIDIQESGMQQIKLHVPGNDLEVKSAGWDVEKAENGMYVLTRFGGPTGLELSYSK